MTYSPIDPERAAYSRGYEDGVANGAALERITRFLDPDPLTVEGIDYDEPPRRVSLIWLLGIVVVAAVVIGAVMVRR